MRKYLVRAIAFAAVFSLTFIVVQNVLHYRWSGSGDLYTRYLDYVAQPPNSLDVLYFGTSEAHAMYAPIITYHEGGITGYNFATSSRSAVTAYYQLVYALKYHTPKVVMCDFTALYDDQLPGDVEELYRKVVETMPDREIKNALIREIYLLDKEQQYLSWKLPLLRYHDMWNELTLENFEKDYEYDNTYRSYEKGALLREGAYEPISSDLTNEDITPELWNAEDSGESFSEISLKYYDMFIEECQSRGIQVVALLPPKMDAAAVYTSRWKAMKEYFDNRGVDYLNYNTYEQITRIGLVLEEDYYNEAHVNLEGSIKISKALTEDLKSMYEFEDRRSQPQISSEWDAAWDEFVKEKNVLGVY